MNFIKQIVENQVDEATHKRFARYGKGEYERGLLLIKKSKKNIRLKGSYDWSNDFFGIIANNISEDTEVKGNIVATRDFESELDVETIKYSKWGKMYTAEIKLTLTPEQMKSIYEKFKGDFILLSIKSDDFKLSVKNKVPKPGGKIKDNFCSATLPLNTLDEFAFDFDQDFTEVSIVNKFIITDLEVPDEYKKDFAQARLMAKRKGKLIRTITADGNNTEKEYPMEA
ncbi:MAG: hypothetical protein KKA79_04160 [Nanoarchaeota archaeon]|nr:hypothetical protein [Nanoarchaeota archaeon]